MTIPSIPASTQDIASLRADHQPSRAGSEGSVPVRTQGTVPPTQAQRTTSRANTTTLPSDAPEGTDPALWSVLTKEERAFFSRSAGSGPLTYTKMMMPNRTSAPASAVARGGRVDVRA